MKLRLRSQFVAFAVIVVVLVGGSIGAHTAFQGRRNISMQFEKENRETAALIARVLASDLYFLDVEAVRQRLRTASVHPDIVGSYVTDANGLMISDGTSENLHRDEPVAALLGETPVGLTTWTVGAMDGIQKIRGPVLLLDGTTVGYLGIDFSLERPSRAVRRGLQSALLVTGACLALGIGLAYVLSARLTRPISRLTAVAREIGEGRFDVRLPVLTRDELGDLADAVNRMAASTASPTT